MDTDEFLLLRLAHRYGKHLRLDRRVLDLGGLIRSSVTSNRFFFGGGAGVVDAGVGSGAGAELGVEPIT